MSVRRIGGKLDVILYAQRMDVCKGSSNQAEAKESFKKAMASWAKGIPSDIAAMEQLRQ